MKNIIVVGTFDTKLEPLLYLASRINDEGCKAILIDLSTHFINDVSVDISADDILRQIGKNLRNISKLSRGKAVEIMSVAATKFIIKNYFSNKKAHAIIGLGGSGGTTLASSIMRNLPYGIPKLIVSTLASSNTSWYVGISDIIMMPSIVDVAGMNTVLKIILNNAARAITGMAKDYDFTEIKSDKKVVSATMYGTTTCGVGKITEMLNKHNYETWIFHASGIGGRTMERLIYEKKIHFVLDMTLAEIGAHLVGGIHDGGSDRLEAAGKIGIPQVIVPGAVDTIVLPPIDKIPDKFRNMILNIHNPNMTTMRTNIEENKKIGEFIANKLNSSNGPVVIILPLKGLSSIDLPGKIFYCPEANNALFITLKNNLSNKIKIIELNNHICDEDFALFVFNELIGLMKNYYGE